MNYLCNLIEKVAESIAQACIIYHQYIKSTGKLRVIDIQHESPGSCTSNPSPVPSKMKVEMLTSHLGLKLMGALPNKTCFIECSNEMQTPDCLPSATNELRKCRIEGGKTFDFKA